MKINSNEVPIGNINKQLVNISVNTFVSQHMMQWTDGYDYNDHITDGQFELLHV